MDATTTTLAAALSVSVLVGLLTFYAMGLFGGNEMPVDGKVTYPPLHLGFRFPKLPGLLLTARARK